MWIKWGSVRSQLIIFVTEIDWFVYNRIKHDETLLFRSAAFLIMWENNKKLCSRNIMKILITFALLSFPILTLAQAYQCEVDGRTVFQRNPCVGQIKSTKKYQDRSQAQIITDLTSLSSGSHTMAFNRCKSEVVKLQLKATQQSFRTQVLNNSSTNYNVRVCTDGGSIAISCDSLQRKLSVNRARSC